MVELDELNSRYEAVRVAEDNKDKIIEELLTYVKDLQKELQLEKNESEDQKKLVQVYKEDARKCEGELKEKSRMEFMDELIQDGQKGGRTAAKALIEAARCHIREVKPDSSPNIQFIIRVYANVAGLAKVYSDSGIVSSVDVVRCFIQGFNMENTLCEFVDAGSGKECSDVKIGAHFDHYLHDLHCQHIIFCGSADNGYARRFSVKEVSEKSFIQQQSGHAINYTSTDADSKLRLYSKNSGSANKTDSKTRYPA
ncbi:hypothetical protein N7462_009933 [Penicillium macrosclerotiorum]|uniref:uncharacterized protein n=1 Tax=Penicillium macrosclerotiorum TaxID=303699 RepID=UPI0025483F61|nr:uncharacterized protein N7462_009933 [Penicillium macrosclerotiorum]KAJ5668863.1 hypothetical protein N7462_009933 [Penicillium macrosclerotiorum]